MDMMDSGGQYRALAELSPDAILVSAEGRIVYANAAATRLLGAEDAGEIIGLTPLDVVEPEYQGLAGARIRFVLEEQRTAPRTTYRWKRLDGSTVDVETEAGPLLWGDVPAAQVVARDITERRRVEEARRASQERLRSVLENSLDAAYRRDLRTESYDYLSPAVEEVLGLSIEQLQAMPPEAYLERIHAEDLERVLEAMREGGRSRFGRVEYRFRANDGRYRWLSDNFTVQTDDAGVPISRTGVVRNVTGNREILEALSESEEKYRTLFGSMEEGFCIIEVIFDAQGRGVDHRFLETNPAFERQTGLVDPAGRTARELVPNLESRWPERYGRIAVSRVPERFVMESEAMGRWFEVDAFPVGTPDEGRVGLLFMDVTERKSAERALREARDLAEAASESKTQFLSTMSHELRTPLTAVIGFTDLLATEVAGPMTAKQREHLARIKASAWHLVSIIDEILSFSRTERGKAELKLEELDVSELARGVVAMLTTEAAAKGLDLRLSGAAERVAARTDGGKIRQVLINLVGNAVKYTESGVVDVELQAGADTVEVHVRDTGPGIPPDRLEDVFEPFVQVDQSSTRSKGGTGLGLAISRRLARLLGGDVVVDSTPGEGSTFTLRVPRWTEMEGTGALTL